MAPAGGAKGAMLALTVELLCCALTGAAFGFEADSFFDEEGNRPRIGQAFLVIDPPCLHGNPGFIALSVAVSPWPWGVAAIHARDSVMPYQTVAAASDPAPKHMERVSVIVEERERRVCPARSSRWNSGTVSSAPIASTSLNEDAKGEVYGY
jgi:hypothetical protein